jgi:large subunit ribosomal protein L24e
MRKKNPRKLKWTKAYRAAQGKDLLVDSTFDFEQRRNRPVKYDRNLMETTLRTMRLVDEIRQQREAAHWERRMRTAAAIESRHKLIDIAQNINLIEKNPEIIRQEVQRAESELQEHKKMAYEERKQLRKQQPQ